MQHQPAQRLLVVMPSWIGDAVMATPTLRALRQLYPAARITALARSTVRPILDGCPWVDRMITVRPPRRGMNDGRRKNIFALAGRLSAGHFDTAVLLSNSFRSALLVRMAGVKRRIGYDRDGRGTLLTDRLLPRREQGRFVPVPALDYYLGVVRYLGAMDPDLRTELFTRSSQDIEAQQILAKGGFDPQGSRRLVIINPGANFGDAKMWYPERFAAVADRCAREHDVAVAVSGSPRERLILDKVIAAMKTPALDLPALGIDLSLLKSVIRRASLLVTNDTGPRHIAAALGVPVVTVFGPTDPAWTVIDFAQERQVMVKVFCGPCQKKKCPLDHRCMTQIEPDMVYAQASALLEGAAQTSRAISTLG